MKVKLMLKKITEEQQCGTHKRNYDMWNKIANRKATRWNWKKIANRKATRR